METSGVDASSGIDGEDVADAAMQASDAPPGIWVDSASGSDTNAGDYEQPYKTITHAIAMTAAGETIRVRPGVYDTANGETFPLRPDGEILIGDEATKGAGTIITTADPAFLSATVIPGASSTIAGFTITNTAPQQVGPMIVIVNAERVTLRNNTMTSAPDSAVYFNGGTNGIVTGNVIELALWSGVVFVGSSASNRLEGNQLTRNRYGASFDTAGGDLGGGSTGSTGGNILSCNTTADVSAGAAVSAHNNQWDHVPPTTADITGGSPVGVVGATLAPSPCP